MIVVTGATGNVGRPLVRALVAAGEEVTAVSRRDGDVPAGVRHVRADMADPLGLVPALEGADSVFLLTGPDFLANGDLGKVVDVLRDNDVRRVVYLSSRGVTTGRHAPVMEESVTRSGLDWTILRPGGFHSNALQWAETIRTQRMLAAPFGDIGLPNIDPTDIADVAAVTLREPGHTGKTYELTGPAPVSPRQQAEAIADVLGEPVRFAEQTRAEARELMVRYMPEPIVEITLDVLGTPSPEDQRVCQDVPALLGRPARTFAEWAAENVVAFR